MTLELTIVYLGTLGLVGLFGSFLVEKVSQL